MGSLRQALLPTIREMGEPPGHVLQRMLQGRLMLAVAAPWKEFAPTIELHAPSGSTQTQLLSATGKKIIIWLLVVISYEVCMHYFDQGPRVALKTRQSHSIWLLLTCSRLVISSMHN